MKKRRADCPACGGPVTFRPGTVVAVCEYCQSAVARQDKRVEDYGKVADLLETSSRLQIGMTGRFANKHFTVVGRVQYRHPAGGVWDEWYLAFPGGKWGWLAESQGKTHLFFQRRLKRSYRLPDFDSLSAGQNVRVGKDEFQVVEKGIAKAIAATGEIPWAFRADADHKFADLQNPAGIFATFDFTDQPSVFFGQEIKLSSLDLQGHGYDPEQEKIATAALLLNCPQCGGQVTLRAPDQSLRVSCQHCHSLLSASEGKLNYLFTMKTNERLEIAIPLGSEGTIDGVRYTVIGFLQRYAKYAGRQYPWKEYLLYEQDTGFRWLVENDRHWSFVQPVSEGLDISRIWGNRIRYDWKSFRIYDRGVAHVGHVIGEFYWQVSVGEQVRTADFIAPPRMLSIEISGDAESNEIVASVGHYVQPEDIESAFGIAELPRPWSVGPIQPAPPWRVGIFAAWIGFLAYMVGTLMRYENTAPGRPPDGWMLWYGILLISILPAGLLAHRYSFEVSRWKDSDYSPYASDDDS